MSEIVPVDLLLRIQATPDIKLRDVLFSIAHFLLDVLGHIVSWQFEVSVAPPLLGRLLSVVFLKKDFKDQPGALVGLGVLEGHVHVKQVLEGHPVFVPGRLEETE
jgi:hypothetical protein